MIEFQILTKIRKTLKLANYFQLNIRTIFNLNNYLNT